MTRILSSVFITVLLILFLAPQGLAQQASDESQRSLLPDIDPQDIEIRSQFQARFPGLRRQPILGFNPQPRIFQIDPNRTPFIEDEETVAASLTIVELDRPEAPQYKPLTYADPRQGFARLGIGSYITPEADIFATARLGERQWVSANINYRSSDGHLDLQNSSYRNFDGIVRTYNHISDSKTLRVHAGGRSDFNYLTQNVTPAGFVQDSEGRVAQNGFRLGASLLSNRTAMSGWQASVNGFGNQYEITGGSGITMQGDASEWGLTAGGGYAWLGSRVEEAYSLNVSVKTGEISLLNGDSEVWNISQATMSYDRLFNYQTDFKLQMGVAIVTDAVNGTTFYPAPKVDVRHTLFSGLDVRGVFAGTPDHKTLSELRGMNRFQQLTDPVEHQYTLEGRAELIAEPLSGTSFRAGFGYETIQNHFYYRRGFATNQDGVTEAGAYRLHFQDASFLRLYGSFTQKLVPEKLWIQAEGYLQRPRFSNGDKIPFTEASGLTGSISYMLTSEVLLEGWAELKGSRYHPDGNEDLSAYALLGAKFEYSLQDRFGIYGKLVNITDTQYELWQGFPERGFQGFVGITILF